jgi:hypothetical protein
MTAQQVASDKIDFANNSGASTLICTASRGSADVCARTRSSAHIQQVGCSCTSDSTSRRQSAGARAARTAVCAGLVGKGLRMYQVLTKEAHLPVALVAILAQQCAVLLGVQPGLKDVVAVGTCGPQLTHLPLDHCWAHLAVILVGAGISPLGLLSRVCKWAGGPVMHEPLQTSRQAQHDIEKAMLCPCPSGPA